MCVEMGPDPAGYI